MSEENRSVCEEKSLLGSVGTRIADSSPPEFYELHENMPDIGVIFHMDKRVAQTLPVINWHENVEIIFVRAGAGTVLCNSEQMPAEAGDVFVFSCHHMHNIFCVDGSIVYDVLIVDRKLCRTAGIDTNTLLFTPRIQGDERLVRLYRAAVASAARGAAPSAVSSVHGAVLSLVSYLCRFYSQRAAEEKSRAEHGVRRVIRYMQSHVAENMTVDTLASVASFSKYHFLREFKKYTSYTVVTYLNVIRVERAKQMLSCGSSVSEAALSCGFGNFSYFSKVFRAHTGMSPMDFVKREVGGKRK